MQTIKKALTALAATAVLAPTLVACGQRELISLNHDVMGEVHVDCAAGKVSLPNGRISGFYTPEKLAEKAVRVATKDQPLRCSRRCYRDGSRSERHRDRLRS